jgi:hypothetical protein
MPQRPKVRFSIGNLKPPISNNTLRSGLGIKAFPYYYRFFLKVPWDDNRIDDQS